MKRRGACESSEAPVPKRVCQDVLPSDNREDLALVSRLIEDVKGAVVEASLAWQEVEDRKYNNWNLVKKCRVELMSNWSGALSDWRGGT